MEDAETVVPIDLTAISEPASPELNQTENAAGPANAAEPVVGAASSIHATGSNGSSKKTRGVNAFGMLREGRPERKSKPVAAAAKTAQQQGDAPAEGEAAEPGTETVARVSLLLACLLVELMRYMQAKPYVNLNRAETGGSKRVSLQSCYVSLC